MKVVFVGTSAFAVPVLAALRDSPHEIALVLTQPDRPAGRGRKLQATPVDVAAAGLPSAKPDALRDPAIRDRVAMLAPDVLIVVAYGRLVPRTLFDLPRYGAINVHPSLLPRWRGAAPVERALLAGDKETGVAIMRMTSGLDAGPIYRMERTAIGASETAGELSMRLAELGAALLLQTLDDIAMAGAPAKPQAGEPTYAERLTVAEAKLDFAQSAEALGRRIRAFNPRPAAWCECAGERLRLFRAEALGEPATAAPGTIVAAGENGLDVAVGEGVLRVTELQRAGRKRQSGAEFARGQEWAGRRLG